MRKQELLIFIAVVIFITIIFLSYISISLFSGNEKATSKPSISPTKTTPLQTSFEPTSTPTFSATPLPSGQGLTKEELITQLPQQTGLFNIEYYYQDDLFKVTIKENPYEENKTKAEEWFKNLGFDPNYLNIYWFAFPEVQR